MSRLIQPRHVALYFGSFNPVHMGHLHIAKTIQALSSIDELWFVPSPQNPLKSSLDLIPFDHRVRMLELVLTQNPFKRYDFKICDIEKDMPMPSYTFDTLKALEQKHSNVGFSIVIGLDNVFDLPKWKGFKQLNERYEFIVFPRSSERDVKMSLAKLRQVRVLEESFLEVSSSQIRTWLSGYKLSGYKLSESQENEKDIKKWVHSSVIEYILDNGLYQTKESL